MPQDVNARNQVDTNLQTTKALPATASNNAHDGIDSGTGPHRERMEVFVDVPATPNLADTKTITFALESSADNSTFAAVSPAQSGVITGAGGSGADAAEFRFSIPSTADRYLRVTQTAVSSAGDSTGVTATVSLLS